MSDRFSIPPDIQEVCRKIAKAAKDAGIREFTGEFIPGSEFQWWSKVHFSWTEGRHGADSNKLNISSTCLAHTFIEDKGGKQ